MKVTHTVNLTPERRERIAKLFKEIPSAAMIYDCGLDFLEIANSSDTAVINALLIKKAKRDLGLQ